MGLLREQCAEPRKGHLRYCCNEVWTKNGGRIPWNATATCESFKIHCLMGRHSMRGDSEYHLMARLFRLVPWSNIILFLLKNCRDCINSVQKSCQVYFLVMSCMLGVIWKGDILVADIEELEKMDASELHARRLNAKEVLTPMSGEKFIFPIADGTVKLSGGDQRLRTSTLIQERPDRGREQGNLQGQSDGSSSTPLQNSSWYDGEARNDFWSTPGNFIYRHHVEPRVKLYVPTEESFPIPLIYRRYHNYTYILDVRLEKNIEDSWNVDGDRELWETWTGFERFTVLNEKPPDGKTCPGGDWQENKRLPGQTLCGQKCGNMCLMHQNAKRNKSGLSRKQSSTMPEDCVVFTSLILMMRNSRVSWINARRKLEIPMPAAMPCILQRDKYRETYRTVEEHKTKYAYIVEAKDSMRKRMAQESWRSYCRKRVSHYNMVRKFIPMIQAGSTGDRMGKTRENTCMTADESQKQKWGDRWSKKWGQKSSFCVVDGPRSSQDFAVGATVSKIQRSSRTPRWHCERWFRIVCRIHWAGIISISNDSRKCHGHFVKTTRMRRTSSRRSIILLPGKNGRCSQITENSQIGMSRHLDSSPTTQMA